MKQQMHLGFEEAVPFRAAMSRKRRMGRARWWFEQMRQVVDRALEHKHAPPARPQQTYFALPSRGARCARPAA